MMRQPNRELWIGQAREQLRQRFALAAGINPNSGFHLDEDEEFAASLATPNEHTERLSYLATFRDRAVSHISGALDTSALMAWRQLADGRLEPVGPIWAGQRFFEANGDVADLMIDQVEWETWLQRFEASVAPAINNLSAKSRQRGFEAQDMPLIELMRCWIGETHRGVTAAAAQFAAQAVGGGNEDSRAKRLERLYIKHFGES